MDKAYNKGDNIIAPGPKHPYIDIKAFIMYDHLPVNNNEAENSFEMNIDGQWAFIDYQKRGEVYQLVHTQVPEKLQGQGIAATLVENTFKYLEEHQLKMIPYCAYIQAYLKKHPEWDRLIADQV